MFGRLPWYLALSSSESSSNNATTMFLSSVEWHGTQLEPIASMMDVVELEQGNCALLPSTPGQIMETWTKRKLRERNLSFKNLESASTKLFYFTIAFDFPRMIQIQSPLAMAHQAKVWKQDFLG
jgi:hypothetical protein